LVKQFWMAAAVVAMAGLAACGGDDPQPAGPSSLQIEDITVGTGATAAVGDTISVFYVLRLLDGRVVQDSRQIQATPVSFALAPGGLIQGWIEGIPGMKVGGKRKLTIPPHLGYADRPPAGSGIPSNATLVFEIELVAIAGK
jgi:FKBP-type peptidyl-prolyl cis-trans isomerase